DHVQIACDETTTPADVEAVLAAFASPAPVSGDAAQEAGRSGIPRADVDLPEVEGAQAPVNASARGIPDLPAAVTRQTPYLQHPIFHIHRSETSMLRYLRSLSDKDLALDRTMIPLGSCTMKLNSTAEMESISWPEFANIHPYAPASQTAGWRELIADLESRLLEITGYSAISLQPNAGSQGEYAGLLAIRRYHLANGDDARDVCLIPASAHGTN